MQRSASIVLTGLTDEAFFISCREKLRARNGSQAQKIASVDALRLERQNDLRQWTTVLGTADFSTLILNDGGFEDAMIRGVLGRAVLDEYPVANQSASLAIGISAIGLSQSIELDAHVLITGLEFNLAKAGSPGGSFRARVYAPTGTHGTSAKPTGSALASSEIVAASTLTTNPAFTWTSLPLIRPLRALAGSMLCVGLEYSGSADSTNHLVIGYDTSAPTHAGNSALMFAGGVWVTNPPADFVFRVRGVRVPAPSDRYRFVAECTVQNLVSGVQTPDVFRAPAVVVASAENPVISGVS